MPLQPLLPQHAAVPRASLSTEADESPRSCRSRCSCAMVPLKVALAVLLMAAVAISGALSYTLGARRAWRLL